MFLTSDYVLIVHVLGLYKHTFRCDFLKKKCQAKWGTFLTILGQTFFGNTFFETRAYYDSGDNNMTASLQKSSVFSFYNVFFCFLKGITLGDNFRESTHRHHQVCFWPDVSTFIPILFTHS